jgi:hypothetical protein
MEASELKVTRPTARLLKIIFLALIAPSLVSVSFFVLPWLRGCVAAWLRGCVAAWFLRAVVRILRPRCSSEVWGFTS